jgi:hypothetical protein
MKRQNHQISLWILIAALSACAEPGANQAAKQATKVGNPPLPQLSLEGIYAVGLVAQNSPPSTIVGIQASGETVVLDDKSFIVNQLKGISGGFLMDARRIGFDERKIFFTRHDGKVLELPSEMLSSERDPFVNFVGQSASQDLYFRDGRILKFDTGTWTNLNLNIENAVIEEVSDHHALIKGKGLIRQVFDLNSKLRFNVSNPIWLVSLNEAQALLGPTMIVNTDSGREMPVPTRLVHRAVRAKSGIVAITDQCEGEEVQLMSPTGFLCLIRPDLTTELLLNEETSNKPEDLVASGDYIMIRELKKLYVIKPGLKSKVSILDNLNVFEAHLSEGFVYYRAETLDGQLLTQVYDIEKTRSYEVRDWSSRMIQIQAIRK